MMPLLLKITSVMALFVWSSYGFAQETPRVGRGAAAKYFQNNNNMETQEVSDGEGRRSPSSFGGSTDHFLALHFGKYTGSQAYEWGIKGRDNNVGQFNSGVTYRIGEWENSMDLNLRVDYLEFDVQGENVSKISIMPLITFPDAAARFPLYFGVGGGLGVFLNQIEDKSPVSFDYQLVLGARFFNVFENTGFFIESGLKNHLHLLTSGQLNGSFVTFGAIFTF